MVLLWLTQGLGDPNSISSPSFSAGLYETSVDPRKTVQKEQVLCFFWPFCMACGSLVPPSRTVSVPPAVDPQES